MTHGIKLLAAAVFAVAGLSACGDSGSGPDAGKLTVLLTDAPFPYSDVSRVDMWVVRIEARQSEVDADATADAGARGGWLTIAEPNSAINLLALQNGTTTNLGTTSLTSGTYNAFRMILDTQKSSITLKDGTVLTGTGSPNIVWPSAAQTGVKIFLETPIQITQDSSVMVIDFDVGNSFVLRGHSISQNGLLFKPVIRAVARELTGSVSGSVRGDSETGAGIVSASVELLKSGTALTDTDATNVLRQTSTDASGNFRLAFLPAGTYEVRATPPAASGYKPALLSGGVTVTSGTEVSGKIIVVTK
jgi:hypothetical protein